MASDCNNGVKVLVNSVLLFGLIAYSSVWNKKGTATLKNLTCIFNKHLNAFLKSVQFLGKVMSGLTADQLRIIEAKRKLALQIKEAKQAAQQNLPKTTTHHENICNQSENKRDFVKNENHSILSFYGSNNVNTPSKPNIGITSKFLKPTSTAIFNKSKQFSQPPIVKQTPFVQKGKKWNSDNCVVAKCHLISKTQFAVDVKYHQQLINIFKSMKSALYDAKNRQWSFHLNDYSELMMAMTPLTGEVTLKGLPKIILETFRNPKPEAEVTDDELLKIDPELFSHLMVFQKEGVRFGLSKCGRCLLADDMGLGKTIQALGIMHYYRGDWPLLIVCPSSVRYDWLEAIQTWLPTIPTHHVEVMTSGKDDIEDARVLITSYDLMSRYGKQWLAQKSFGAVIMDESHFLKSFKSARTKVAILFFKQAKRVLLLSGTPALSRPAELYTQIAAIDPKAFGSFHDFGLRYCAAVKTNWAWDYSGSSNMVELHLLLEKRFMIRRLKSNVISELPPKIRELVILSQDMIKGTSSEMKGCEKALNVQGLRGIERRGALLSYYCATGKAKLPAIVDYIHDLLDSGRKFICFAHHHIVLDGICEAIEERNLSYIRIDGSTPSEVRKQHCDLFQYNDEVMVAVLSITAANSGITLTSAHLVVFAELFWNPGILTQAEDRAHRLGQQDSVLVRYLVARGTADDHLWPLIQAKLDVLNKAGLSKDNFLNSHSTEMKSRQQSSLVDFFEELIEDEENGPIGPKFETNQPAPREEDNSAELWEIDEEDLLAKIDLEQIEQIESKRRRMNESSTQKHF